jgi:hypothetical protein
MVTKWKQDMDSFMYNSYSLLTGTQVPEARANNYSIYAIK